MITILWALYHGTDAAENMREKLAYMDAIITDSAHGSEASSLRFYVAENDATLTQGLLIAGQADDDGEVDVTIGAGAASTTTIAGTLTMGSTAAMTNAGLLSVANQTNITGTGTVTSGTWNSAGTLTTASQPNITTLAGLSAIGTASTALTVTSDAVTFVSANTDDPLVTIKNTTDDADGEARLRFLNQRGSTAAAGQDLDNCGSIEFSGYNDAGTPVYKRYGLILSEIVDATAGSEKGEMRFGVASYNATNRYGLVLTGTDTSGEVDVTIGLGADSVTTVSGNLTVAGGGITITPVVVAAADATGLGGGALIPELDSLISATSDSVHKAIVLPDPVLGRSLRIINVGAFELKTSDPSNVAINGGTGSNVESAIAANMIVDCVCTTTTTWVCTQTNSVGVQSPVQVAA